MSAHSTGCIICGKDLQYFQTAKTLKCEICGHDFETTASCEDNHYICDSCHSQPGYQSITNYALKTESKNPITISHEMMRQKFINMHGPEHHYLVIAALLAAYKNAGGHIELEKGLETARQRAKEVPGGICGLWGSCGAGIGSGIFISIITGATPLSEGEWALSNKMTSLSLEAISRNGGPRCCKRDTYLAVLTAVDFVREQMGISMEKPEAIKCSFFNKNSTCRQKECFFYPTPKSLTFK